MGIPAAPVVVKDRHVASLKKKSKFFARNFKIQNVWG